MRSRPNHRQLLTLLVPTLMLLAAGCSGGGDQSAGDSTSAAMSADLQADSVASPGVVAVSADQEFLRRMSDHHVGLIHLAHETMEQKAQSGVADDARRIDEAQDAELDRMVTMLEQQFHDPYAPQIAPESEAAAADLLRRSGADFEQAFRDAVIAHHRQGMRIIDDYLPKLTRDDLSAMARAMRTAESQEIARLERAAAPR